MVQSNAGDPPQGDLISLLLFLMCINPIIEYINQKGERYKLNKWMKINVLAYADDIVLIDSNRKEIEKTLKRLEKWMNTYGLTINHNKSAYTHNYNKAVESIYVQNKEIPRIAKNESYLYLGKYLNIDLNWEKHERTMRAKFLWRLKLIKSKKLTMTQAVSIINIVANAYVIYAMDIYDFNSNTIKELDDKAAKLIKMKAGISPKSGNVLLYAPLEQGGLGLIKLTDKMMTIKITGFFFFFYCCR